jgi:hypothetical protein
MWWITSLKNQKFCRHYMVVGEKNCFCPMVLIVCRVCLILMIVQRRKKDSEEVPLPNPPVIIFADYDPPYEPEISISRRSGPSSASARQLTTGFFPCLTCSIPRPVTHRSVYHLCVAKIMWKSLFSVTASPYERLNPRSLQALQANFHGIHYSMISLQQQTGAVERSFWTHLL